MSNIKNKYKEAYIYGLIDPRDNQIRYVGWTIDLENRYKKHLSPSCLKSKNHKNHWIKHLLSIDIKPEMVLLEIIEVEEIVKKEKEWISFFGRENLTNDTDGGEGSLGYHPTEETLKKMSESNKGKPASFKGHHHTEESKRKLSEAHKGIIRKEKRPPISEETRLKMSESKKRRIFTDKDRENLEKARERNREKHSKPKEIIEKVIKMLNDGYPDKEISRILSINNVIVSKVRKGFYFNIYGIKVNDNIKPKYDICKENYIKIKELLDKGISNKEIIAILGVSKSAVDRVKNNRYKRNYET